MPQHTAHVDGHLDTWILAPLSLLSLLVTGKKFRTDKHNALLHLNDTVPLLLVNLRAAREHVVFAYHMYSEL